MPDRVETLAVNKLHLGAPLAARLALGLLVAAAAGLVSVAPAQAQCAT